MKDDLLVGLVLLILIVGIGALMCYLCPFQPCVDGNGVIHICVNPSP